MYKKGDEENDKNKRGGGEKEKEKGKV